MSSTPQTKTTPQCLFRLQSFFFNRELQALPCSLLSHFLDLMNHLQQTLQLLSQLLGLGLRHQLRTSVAQMEHPMGLHLSPDLQFNLLQEAVRKALAVCIAMKSVHCRAQTLHDVAKNHALIGCDKKM